MPIDGGQRPSGWYERAVLFVWRFFPRRSRRRHRQQVEATLAEMREERAGGAARDARLLVDAMVTLMRAWTHELGRRLRRKAPRRADHGSGRPMPRAGPVPEGMGPGRPGPGRERLEPEGQGWTWLESVAQDLRHSLRTVRRAPGFTVVAILALGLGIGGTTTFFSVVDGVLLEPLPYPGFHRLVRVEQFLQDRGLPDATRPAEMSYRNLVDLRSSTDVFESAAGVRTVATGTRLYGPDGAVDVQARIAEPELFRVFGTPPLMGRTLQPGDRDVVVLGHELWRRRFDADPGVVGRTVSLDRRPHVIVGVMPAEFLAEVGAHVYGLYQDLPRLWVPLDPTSEPDFERRSAGRFTVFGRLADGVTLEQARVAVAQTARRLAEAHPEDYGDWSLWVTPLHAVAVGDAGATVWLLFGAVAVLLLIACGNVANLQLARLSSRRRETAVRSALGAGRARIVQQFLVESLVLGILGGLLGVLLAVWGVRILVALGPAELPRLGQVGVDGTVLAFAVAVSILTGLLFGLAPAFRGARTGIAAEFAEGSRQGGPGPGARRLRDGLMAAEVAMAVLLLAGAGLMINSFLRLWTYDPGFDPENVLTFELWLDSDRYGDDGARHDFYRRLRRRLEALPGVEAVGETNRLPVTDMDVIGSVIPEDRPDEELDNIYDRPVSGDYLEALGIPLLAGRSQRSGERTTVLVNASAARSIWPGVSPDGVLGRRLRRPKIPGLPEELQPERPWLEVVGVVGDTRYRGLQPEPRPEIYIPLSRARGHRDLGYVVVRTRGDPLELVPAVRQAVRDLDHEEPLRNIRTMEEVISASMARPRFYSFLFSVFGVLALALASVGVFGVAAYTVARRTREIGVRMALGARAANVLRLVLGRGLGVVAVGVALGLMAAGWLGRFVEGFLYGGVNPNDPVTLGAVCAVLVLVALVAMIVPARRAVRVDPVQVLRED